MPRPKPIEIGTLIAATAAVAWMVHSVPSWRDAVAGPSIAANLAAAALVAVLWVILWRRRSATQAELWLLAVFLGGMPVVYVAQYLTANAKPSGWFWLEVAGIPIFATLAVLGVKISPWFLVIGI